jgi:hypothetical protein
MHILVVDWKFKKFIVKQTKRKKNLVSKHTLIPLHNWTIFCFCTAKLFQQYLTLSLIFGPGGLGNGPMDGMFVSNN